jgi:hypothetical protein
MLKAVQEPFLWHVLRREEERGETYSEWGKLKERDHLEAKTSQSNLAATFRSNLLPSSSRVSSGLLNSGHMNCGNKKNPRTGIYYASNSWKLDLIMKAGVSSDCPVTQGYIPEKENNEFLTFYNVHIRTAGC